MSIKWIEPQIVTSNDEIRGSFKESIILAGQLSKKGVFSIREANEFLNPEKPRQVSPFDFPDMEKAAMRVQKAIKHKEHIGVWGDFDVDGQTSTALLVDGLRKLGAEVVYHIPVRKVESHGIQLDYLKPFLNQSSIQLLITCDTGITEFDSLEYLASTGTDTIITDHHTPEDKLPQVCAIINPKLLPSGHSLSALAGVGTAFQLIQALFILSNMEDKADSYYDLVALGTIADLADLVDENRFYTKRGLQVMNTQPRQAFKAISKSAGFRDAVISESHIGFTFAPRLNALGRLGDANPIVDFLITEDEDYAFKIAASLEIQNNQRKLAVAMVFQSALEQLERNKELLQYPVIVLEQKDWEKGVVGIAASRLSEKFNKPTILFSSSDGKTSGSARSVEGINIIQAIRENSQFFIKCGGHSMAAGLSIPLENISAFREGLSKSVLKISAGQTLEKTLEIDAYLPFEAIKESLLHELEQLAPFGPGNPAPVIVTRNIEIEKSVYIGKTKEHRALLLKDRQGYTKKALWWNCVDTPLPDGQFELAYYLQRDNYNQDNNEVLEWVDFRLTDNTVINAIPQIERFRIQDYRNSGSTQVILEALAKDPDAIIWGEPSEPEKFHSLNRLEIHKSQILAVLNPPPGREVLNAVVEKAEPTDIFLFSIAPVDDSMKAFTMRLVGLINFCLSHQDGKASIERFSAALGQLSGTVIHGLELLKAAGKIEFKLHGSDVFLNRANNIHFPNTNIKEKALGESLNETAAFRSYYRRCDPNCLFSRF